MQKVKYKMMKIKEMGWHFILLHYYT